jgi:hypothetical protein
MKRIGDMNGVKVQRPSILGAEKALNSGRVHCSLLNAA